MLDSLFSFVFKTIPGAFLQCKRPRFNESSSDSDSDDDLKKEKSSEVVVVESPTKKVDISNVTAKSSLRELWMHVDSAEKNLKSLDSKSVKVDYSYEEIKLDFKPIKTDPFPVRFKDLNLSDSDGYISVKVLRQEEDMHVINEFEVSVEEIKQNFRIIKKILPRNADDYRRVPYTAKACIILLRFLFTNTGTYYISNADAALETLVLAQATRLKQLKYECKAFIAANERYLTTNRTEVLSGSECFIGFSKLSSNSNIYFPLYPIQLTLNEAFEKDIINTATIESEIGFYFVTGLELCFNTETEYSDFPLNIICKVSGNNFTFEEEFEVSLERLIYISFQKYLSEKFWPLSLTMFENGQKVEISILVQDIKPSLCFSSLDSQYFQKTADGQFYVSLSSSRKTDSDVSLFYLKKIYIVNVLELLHNSLKCLKLIRN